MELEYNAANRKVSYFYNPIISKFIYAKEHPMRPERIAMAHSLIVNTGLYKYFSSYTENLMFIKLDMLLNRK
jgi:acetoin utilization deacetylase AcuC-like enzyme